MKHIVIILLLILGVDGYAQTTDKFNLNFEKYAPKQSLVEGGWTKAGTSEVDLDSTTAYSGKYAASIVSNKEGGSFGRIDYKIPARYEGQMIQLTGFIKTQNLKNGYAGIVLWTDNGDKTQAPDNLRIIKIDSVIDWKQYSITLPYPEKIENIFLAGILSGEGKAWFDDFVITIDGKNIQNLEEVERPTFRAYSDHEFDNDSKITLPKPDAEKIANLELLGKVWGFLKYYHPEVGAGNYNWDYELFRVLPDYLKAQDDKNRDQVLSNWIAKYGKVPLCEKCSRTPADAPIKPDLSWIENSNLSPELKSTLQYIYENRHQGKKFYIGLDDNAGNPKFLNENPYANMPYPDDGFRLLSLYRYWNAIHYFFPYKSIMDKDWKSTLKEYIPKFIDAKNELAYELAALQIIGEINDTHANLWGGANAINDAKGTFYPPFSLQFVEDKLVVTDYYNPDLKSESGPEIGDAITHINGVSVKNVIDSLSKYYPASNQAARLRNISMEMFRSTKDVVRIKYISENENHEKDLVLYPSDKLEIKKWYVKSYDPKSFKILKNNIGYVTLKSIKQEDIPVIKDSLNNTKGIIIDIRNYPATFVPFSLGTYFISTPTPFVKFTYGSLDNPGEFNFTKPIVIPKSESAETYKRKLVVLVNEQTQSQAEYTAMAFRAGDNTTIMGSTTAGADGNVSTLFLPGELKTMISGLGVYYPDGTETQRVGIIPDIEVKPTIEGIKNGKDELLERAIEFILK